MTTMTREAMSMTSDADEAMVTSLLDTDAYKLHMQQAVFHHFPHVVATYQFQCRHRADRLGGYAAEIASQVRLLAQHAVLTDDEYAYLSTLPHFARDYLDYLRAYRFRPAQVTVRAVPASTVVAAAVADAADAADDDNAAAVDAPRETSHHSSCGSNCVVVAAATVPCHGDDNNNADDAASSSSSMLSITVEGPWVETILWEVPLLAIVSEVVQRRRHAGVGVAEARATLQRRLDVFFAQHSAESLRGFAVSDFGTRRRFSRRVHEAVVRQLRDDARFARHLVGTSNYDLARRLGLPAIGTQAHEWFQAFQQLAPQLRESQTMALEVWLREYQGALGIALTDCITMDTFLRDFRYELARAYTGLRQDSGDPVEWANKALAHYRALGIDTHGKTLVFSDGLTLTRAAALHARFASQARVLCGIGTQLTCAIDGVVPLNIVMKMVRCEGRPVAKVSDSPGKSIAGEAAFVDTLLRTFDVTVARRTRHGEATDVARQPHCNGSSGGGGSAAASMDGSGRGRDDRTRA